MSVRRIRIKEIIDNLIEKIFTYSTNTNSSEDAITQLTLWCVICMLLPIFFVGIYFFIYFILISIGIDIKDDFMVGIIVSVVLLIAGFFKSYDLTHTIVSKEINRFKEKLMVQHQYALENLSQSLKENSENSINELNQTWGKRLKKLENSSDNNIINQQILIYLADLYMANEDRCNREKIILLASKIYGNECESSQVKSNLTKQFANEQERRKLRAVIIIIKKDSWNQLATFAGYHTFSLNPSVLEDKNKLENGSERLFCLDIYTYLYAWLVSSIDNTMARQYMPVKQIGLNYPTVESPDFEKYESAFNYLIDIFTNCELSEMIDNHDLSSEQIEVCQGISRYLEELIKMLKEFYISQRSLAADQIARSSEENP